jgi:hypothetical protein
VKASLLQQSRRSRSRYVFLLIGATALGLMVSCSTLEGVDPPILPVGAEPTEENSWPQTQQSCESAGGRWEQLGILGTGCNLPTSDGGEPCGTYQVCTGLCLPTDPQTMKDDGAGLACPPKTDPVVELGSDKGEGSNATKKIHPRADHQQTP